MTRIQTMKMSSPPKTKCLPNGLRSKDKKKSFQLNSETQFCTLTEKILWLNRSQETSSIDLINFYPEGKLSILFTCIWFQTHY